MSKLLVCLPFFIISPYSTHLLGQEKRWCSWYLDECHKVYLTFFLLSISCTGFFPWTVTTKPSSAYHWQCSSGSLQLELLHWFWKKKHFVGEETSSCCCHLSVHQFPGPLCFNTGVSKYFSVYWTWMTWMGVVEGMVFHRHILFYTDVTFFHYEVFLAKLGCHCS